VHVGVDVGHRCMQTLGDCVGGVAVEGEALGWMAAKLTPLPGRTGDGGRTPVGSTVVVERPASSVGPAS